MSQAVCGAAFMSAASLLFVIQAVAQSGVDPKSPMRFGRFRSAGIAVFLALIGVAPVDAAEEAHAYRAIIMHTRDAGAARSETARALRAQAREQGAISVIVTIDQPIEAESAAAPEVFRRQQSALFAAQDALMGRIYSGRRRLNPADRFETVPLLVMEVNEGELLRLMRDPAVTGIELNQRIRPRLRLEEMRAITRVESIWPPARGDEGEGETIAIIDDGVDRALPAIKGRVVDEQCISGANGCYNPATEEFSERHSSGAYSAWLCRKAPDYLHKRGAYCVSHGTVVTSVAAGAGNGTTIFDGFGPKLRIIFIRVSSESATVAAFTKAFEMAYTSSKLHLAKVITTSIGFVELRSDKPCKGVVPAFDKIAAKIRASGMAITNSAGNDETNTVIDFPGCHPHVLAVGASTEATDEVAGFSDISYMVDFLSPGDDVKLFGGDKPRQGTSFSTPSVAATLAVLKHAFPSKTMDDIVTGLRCGGQYKNRPGTIVSIPRIDAKVSYSFLRLDEPRQDFEFDKPNALKDWTIANGNWTISGGAARYVPARQFTASAIYTDLCLDDFVAEASIKSVTTVPSFYHPTVASTVLLNYVPKGDRLMADKQLLTGYAFTLQKTIGTDSKVAIIQKLTDHALPVGTPPASIQRLVGYTLPAGAAAHLRSSAVVCLNTAVQFDETAANKLRVVKRGTKLQFFVNGTKQCEARADSDDRFRSIGFIASADRINSGADPGRYTSVNYLRVTGK